MLFAGYDDKDIIFNVTEMENYRSRELFVVNTTNTSRHKQPANVQINVQVEGKERTVVIKDSWIPQQISLDAPVSAFFSSFGFTNALRQGLIAIIKPDIARKILAQKDVQEEYARINDLTYAQVNTFESSGEDDKVSPEIKALFDNAIGSADGLSENELYSTLRMKAAILTKDDIAFILSRDGISERIKQLLESIG